MKRIFVLVGTWASIVVIASDCLAADPKKTGNQPAVSPGAGSRFASPGANGGNFIDTNQRAAEARRAAQAAARQSAAAQQAAANAAAARSAAANPASSALQNSGSPRFGGYYPNSPYGYYNNGYYSPYGYSSYNYPPGTSPYVLGYNPSTGTSFLYPYSGGYSSNYPSYGYQYSYYRNPNLGFGYPSAVFAPAGQLYGLGPIQQLMGVSGWFQPPQAGANLFGNGNPNQFANAGAANINPGFANNTNPVPAAPQAAADLAAHKPAPLGGKAMELAWKFITYGDAHFGNQRYSDALDRYRRAASECPRLGDAWFREGFAYAALGRYDQAATAMRRGLEEKPDWVDSNFRLSEVYGGDATEKNAMLDKMVKASESHPTNGNLAYIVGVHLFCEGKSDAAAPFFRRAAQILGSDADVKVFLPKVNRPQKR